MHIATKVCMFTGTLPGKRREPSMTGSAVAHKLTLIYVSQQGFTEDEPVPTMDLCFAKDVSGGTLLPIRGCRPLLYIYYYIYNIIKINYYFILFINYIIYYLLYIILFILNNTINIIIYILYYKTLLYNYIKSRHCTTNFGEVQ